MRAAVRREGRTGRIGAAALAVAAMAAAGAPGAAYATARAPAAAARRAAATTPPTRFIGVAMAGGPTRLAAYAASDGGRLRFLTTQQPGGGAGGPALSADRRTVAFNRALGTCAGAIDTVPADGGRERTLIAMTGSGRRTAIPFDPSYSSDGKFLLYETVRCLAPHRPLVHLRTLATGREMTAPDSRHPVAGGAVLVNSDKQFAYLTPRGQLAVRQVPSFATTIHAPARGCSYQQLAGTERRLIALLQCGTRHQLSVVAVSARTFAVTGTLARLGRCLAGTSLSMIGRARPAILAETLDACGPPLSSRSHILVVGAASVRQVRSGVFTRMPQQVIW